MFEENEKLNDQSFELLKCFTKSKEQSFRAVPALCKVNAHRGAVQFLEKNAQPYASTRFPRFEYFFVKIVGCGLSIKETNATYQFILRDREPPFSFETSV